MKTWNKLFEHHDEEWPQELLSMTVDQVLDKLKEMQLDTEYSAIENILRTCFTEGPMVSADEEIPTFDEIADREPTEFDSMMNKDSWMDSLRDL